MEKDKLVESLRKMGLSDEVINHKAFDLVLDELCYKIKKMRDDKLDYSKYSPNSNTIEISAIDDENNLATGLNVTKNSISFYSSRVSRKVVPMDGDANYWNCYLGVSGNLISKDVFGTSLLKNIGGKNKQFDASNSTTNIYNNNGINTNLEYLDAIIKLPTGTFQPRSPKYYSGIKGTQHKWIIRRDGLDYGYAMQYLNDVPQKEGLCMFSGEGGFQKMRLMNNGTSDEYIYETQKIPERSDEYYKKSLNQDKKDASEVLLRNWGKTSSELKSRSK